VEFEIISQYNPLPAMVKGPEQKVPAQKVPAQKAHVAPGSGKTAKAVVPGKTNKAAVPGVVK
jgi:hypothetical protein